MYEFLRARSLSLSMVVLMLLLIATMQGGISYTLMFGRLILLFRACSVTRLRPVGCCCAAS